MTTPQKLAIDGGSKAFPTKTGPSQPKVGVAEFLALAERFGFSADAMQRLRATITDADLGVGPHLGRYYGSAKPSNGERFEALACEKFHVKFAQAVSSGSGALHAAMIAVGVGPGKEVICPATGFIATGMSAALVGATPIFCDVDESLQLDPSKLEALITPRTVAVVPTHHWGTVCDLAPVIAIARQHKLKVIEDCAQAPGASYHDQPVGSLGDIGCFSISAYKLIGGGEGGMFVTSDERLFDRMRQTAEGGGLWRTNRFAPERYPGELFPGTNYRMSELESTINVVQMQKLEPFVARHRTVSRQVKTQLQNFREIRWQKSNDPAGDIGYQLRYFPQTDELGKKIAAALKAEGVSASFRGAAAGPDWHLSRDMFPLFHTGQPQSCPVAADLYNRCVNIMLDQWNSPADCEAIAGAINKVHSAYCTPA